MPEEQTKEKSFAMEILTETLQLSNREHKIKDVLIAVLVFLLFASNIVWGVFLFHSQKSTSISAQNSSNTIVNDGDITIGSDK